MSVAVADAELEDAPSEQCSYRSRRREAWTGAMDRPLMLASLLFVFVLCAPVLWPHMSRWESDSVNAANIAIWALFVIDYGVRLHLADSKRHHVRHHILDLIVVAVPFFRPLRLLRLFSITGLMARRTREAALKEMTRFICFATFAAWFLGGVVLLDMERGAAHTVVHSFADALWLSCGTLTAVPYGDVYPVTGAGKVFCGVMMVVGLVLVGALTGSIAAWLVTFVTGQPETEDDGAKHLATVLERLDSMEQRLQAE